MSAPLIWWLDRKTGKLHAVMSWFQMTLVTQDFYIKLLSISYGA